MENLLQYILQQWKLNDKIKDLFIVQFLLVAKVNDKHIKGLFGNMQKRFEYWSREGKKWTEWFAYDGEKFPWQLKNKLKNEYR